MPMRLKSKRDALLVEIQGKEKKMKTTGKQTASVEDGE